VAAENKSAAEARTITITRVLNAPRALVFATLIEPKHLVHWFHASGDWTTPYAKTDPKVGGKFDIGFAGPDGKLAFAFEGTYTEVVPPSRLAYIIADGRPVTVTLTEEGPNRTRLDLVLTLETENSEEQQRQGWTEMVVNLETYLARAA
jgi:uncharacterized protein YndB with AHSA1/START domain